jgi:hypothetical protein
VPDFSLSLIILRQNPHFKEWKEEPGLIAFDHFFELGIAGKTGKTLEKFFQ